MSHTLSMDIRDRFRKLFEAGQSARGAGKVLMISPATAVRFGRAIRRGESLEPARTGRKPGTGKLEPYIPFLVELIRQTPDMTLHEMRDCLAEVHGVSAHPSSIDAALKRSGFSYKKRLDRRGAWQDKGAQGPTGMEE